MLRLRKQIISWYAEPAVRNKCLTQIADLTVKMVGTSAKPKLKVKAAECLSLLYFCPRLLETHGRVLGAELPIWRDTINAAIRHMQIMKDEPRNMSASGTQGLIDTFHDVMRGCKRLESYPFMLKLHIWGHMISEVPADILNDVAGENVLISYAHGS